MVTLLKFIFLGLALAAPGEILNQVIARHNPAAFRSTMVSYAVLLFIGFFVQRGLRALIRRPARAMVTYYLLFGCLGLAVEWCLLGNAPVLEPFQVITQPGMFTFWGTMLLGPYLLTERGSFTPLKRAFLVFFVSFSTLYLVLATLIPRDKGGVFFGFIVFAAGSAALNYFYIRYFRLLAIGSPPAPEKDESRF